MKENQNIDRRNFLKTVGVAGLGTAMAGTTGTLTGCKDKEEQTNNVKPDSKIEQQKSEFPQVGLRKLGKTGVSIPCLSLGTMFNLIDNQIILRSTLKYGVNYWDTSNVYAGGNSELGIGKYLSKNPEVRKNLFLVSKASRAKTVDEFEERLQISLQRMNTNYIDLYYAPHGASDPAQFTDELKRWVEKTKKRGLIKFFGFSTHQNMAKCLTAAARLGWIDALMTSYNFRLMQDPEMQSAIDACHKANIGIVAMKTTGKTTLRRFRLDIETKADKKLIEQLQQQGFSQEQATIKLVLGDERISSACVGMESVAVLTANVAAVMNRTELTQTDMDLFKEYAKVTCSGYCSGCADICNAILPEIPYVSDIMRYLMYYNSYGDKNRARELFAQIPANVRNKLLDTDYSAAEEHCPQHMPIAKLVAEAVSKLA